MRLTKFKKGRLMNEYYLCQNCPSQNLVLSAGGDRRDLCSIRQGANRAAAASCRREGARHIFRANAVRCSERVHWVIQTSKGRRRRFESRNGHAATVPGQDAGWPQ